MAFMRRISTIQERLTSRPFFVGRLSRVVDDCVRLASSDNVPRQTWDYCITRLERLQRNLQRARDGGLITDQLKQQIEDVLSGVLTEFRNGRIAHHQVNTGYQAERNVATRGSPRYNISREQLKFLFQCGFKIVRVSQLLGVSVRTIKRRMREYNIAISRDYSMMSEEDLDSIVHHTTNGNQRMGPNAVRARLFAQGHRVQRHRVRESMLRVDPGGAALRTAPLLQRRTYCVAGPNSLWHVDGNHKFIRWRIVVHGGIDGFSRLIVFLHASANNRKDTVLKHFACATAVYGVPSRVRVDHGGENNDLCDLMELLRGAGRGSAIRGRSVHNQRIERAWVDMWNGATNMFYDLFHFLEQSGYLNTDNITHIWALHYVFMPRLNRELKSFKDQWNNHEVRTCRHETPLQLFVGGALDRSNTELTVMDVLFGNRNDAIAQATPANADHDVFNAGWDGQAVVDVPEVPCPLEQDVVGVLQQTIDPLDMSDEIGIDSFLNVLQFVNDRQ